MNQKPFEIGDIVEIAPHNIDMVTNIPRVVTKVQWVGKGRSESGWLIDAKSNNPQYGSRYDLTGYDANWFVKV